MSEGRHLQPGTRVRLRAPSPVLTLRSSTGTIIRADDDLDYYVVRLNTPALSRCGEPLEELREIVEDLDNLALSGLPGG